MEIVTRFFTSPFFYIGLEAAAAIVLLYFIVKWTKLRNQWAKEQELAAKKAKEDELLNMLANNRRKR